MCEQRICHGNCLFADFWHFIFLFVPLDYPTGKVMPITLLIPPLWDQLHSVVLVAVLPVTNTVVVDSADGSSAVGA